MDSLFTPVLASVSNGTYTITVRKRLSFDSYLAELRDASGMSLMHRRFKTQEEAVEFAQKAFQNLFPSNAK